jgi:biopolymer transport protein ExbD
MARSNRRVGDINAGSMADIAFLLLIFFLVTTTMDVDTGITVKLPPIPLEDQEIPPYHARNVFVVLVNARDQLLVEGEWTHINQLREKTKRFLNNYGADPNLSDDPDKAVVSLQNDRGTSYDMYIQVQNELKAAYNELRDNEAMRRFGRKYNELPAAQQAEIRAVYPQKISEAEPKDVGGNI